MSLQSLLASVENLYAQQGAQLRQQTRDAIERQYAEAVQSQARGFDLTNAPRGTSISGAYISFASLERSLADFNRNPRYAVRFRVSGAGEGAAFTDWRTRWFTGPGALPLTVGELKDELWGSYLAPTTEQPVQPDYFSVDEVAITAR